MMDNFEKACTRLDENDKTALAWYKGEKEVGLKNSLFICENGKLTQYVDSQEAENFHNYVKNLGEEEFHEICNEFFEALRNENLNKMHKALAIFDEMDNYQLGTPDMQRRLMRVRKSTHEESYNFGIKGSKDFIIYKDKIYYPDHSRKI